MMEWEKPTVITTRRARKQRVPGKNGRLVYSRYVRKYTVPDNHTVGQCFPALGIFFTIFHDLLPSRDQYKYDKKRNLNIVG